MQAIANRTFLPVKNVLEQVGDMMVLTGKTITSAMRPPYPYGTEFVQQFLFALKLCWLPLLITSVAINYGTPGVEAGNFLVIFGAFDRVRGFFLLAPLPAFGPEATGVIPAGGGGGGVRSAGGGRASAARARRPRRGWGPASPR